MTPSPQEKVEVYERLFHQINLYSFCAPDKIKDCVQVIIDWSYAHRFGNGLLSEEEQEEVINKQFLKMKDL